jgi:hypothetical protein
MTMSNGAESHSSNRNNITKERELNRRFKITHLNIRSLVKNIDQLRVYLQKGQFDVININETMLDDMVADDEVYVRGYNIIRNDRNRNGGGVGYLYKTCD